MKLTELIGNTPLVEMVNINSNPKVKIFGKLEGQNPAGSVKDRAAFNMIHEAILRGDLKSGDTIVEATSGNTGIALAMVGQMMNIRVKLIMPDSATVERVKTMKAYGAEVILTPSEKTIEYSRSLAQELSQTKGWALLDQFGNDDNFKAHIKTTGPEIWEATQGRITHFVSSMGTTGTIMGVSRFLKSKNPDIQIVGCQPTEGSKIPGIRRWTPEFLPKFYDPTRVDQFVDVSQEEAVQMSRKLAKEEGVLAGMSSGGAMHAAVNLAKGLTNGVIVSIVCDRGDRYLSSSLFE